MRTLISSLLFLALSFSYACNTPGYTTNGDSMTGKQGDARNWVMIMHGEACGGADEVASNMYAENNHETKSVTVTVDISWTESNQPRHENKTLTVAPDSKTLIDCDHRNGVYLKMEIVNATFTQ